MDFYYGSLSGNSARVAFTLIEAGAAYTPHLLDTPSGENRAAAYLSLNPMGKIPALVDGDLVLWESNAINFYVAEKYPAAGLLPASSGGRASVMRWLFFQAGHVSPAGLPIMRHTNKRIRSVWKYAMPDPTAVEAARTELARYLTVLDQALAGRDWLVGDFSLADIAYAPHLALIAEGQGQRQGQDGFDFASVPNVRAWLERLWNRPAWKTAAEMTLSGGN
jgi:glutathione S-transferase